MFAYSVARRRGEIGLRIAVGAHSAMVERMFLRESMQLMALGVAIGIPAAIPAMRVASSMLRASAARSGKHSGHRGDAGCYRWWPRLLPTRAASRTDPVVARRRD